MSNPIVLKLYQDNSGRVILDMNLDEVLTQIRTKESNDEKAPPTAICAIGLRELFSCFAAYDAGGVAIDASRKGDNPTEAVGKIYGSLLNKE